MLFRCKYDVFISYAIEDKKEVAEVIAAYLKKRKIKTWFVGSELKVGAEISSVISAGLRNSSYCVIIISPDYTRHWTAHELYRFIEMEKAAGKTLLLPVWHNINYNEVKQQHPMIADRHALLTSNGMETVCEGLYNEIFRRRKSDRRQRLRKVSLLSLLCAVCVFSLLSVFYRHNRSTVIPAKNILAALIQRRITSLESQTENALQQKIATDRGYSSSLDSIFILYNSYVNMSDYDRNEFRFSNGYSIISGCKNIKAAGIPITVAPYTSFNIASPSCFLFEKNLQTGSDSAFHGSFTLLNKTPVSFTIDTIFCIEDKIHLLVSYLENIRSADVTLSYPFKPGNIRKEQVSITGYKPTEEYILEQKNNTWEIGEVK